MLRPLYFGILFLSLNALSFGQQANYKFNNFGNRSILLAGNVTGSVSDLGLAYYNPSRLTKLKSSGFAINAKAYQFSSVSLTNVFGESSKVNTTDFDGVPSMAGATFNLFGTRFAYTFITRLDSDTDLNYTTNHISQSLQEQFPEHIKYLGGYNLKSKVHDEWMGITWAKTLGDNLSIGISGFSSLYSYNQGSTLNHTIVKQDKSAAYYEKQVDFTQNSYGLIFKIGANYSFKNAEIGLNIGLPYIELYNTAKFNYNNLISGLGSDNDIFYDYQFADLESRRKEPLSISIGSGIPFKKHKIHINIDYISGIRQYTRISAPDIETSESELTPVEFKETRRAVLNFGAGAELYVKENLKSFAAFTTDFSGFETNANIFDLSNTDNKALNIGKNFFHMSFGVDWKLKWANAILGATYTGGSGAAPNPFDPEENGLDATTAPDTKARYTRWQFVVGLEVPFLNQKLKSFIQ